MKKNPDNRRTIPQGRTRKYKSNTYVYFKNEDLDVILCPKCRQNVEDVIAGKLVYVQKKNPKRREERIEKIRQMLRDGYSPGEMRRILGISPQAFAYWRKKAREEDREE